MVLGYFLALKLKRMVWGIARNYYSTQEQDLCTNLSEKVKEKHQQEQSKEIDDSPGMFVTPPVGYFW
jgi:hypothetical protein